LLAIAESACIDKHSLEYASICNTYVIVAVEQNDMEMGQEYSKKALVIRQVKLPAFDMNRAASYANYANSLINEGEYDNAIRYMAAARGIWVRMPDESKVYTALAQIVLGRTYALKGAFGQATELFQEAKRVLVKRRDKGLLVV